MTVVMFYKENGKDISNETLHTLCKSCAPQQEDRFGIELEEIDRAGDWDECSVCFCQNVPETYLYQALQ